MTVTNAKGCSAKPFFKTVKSYLGLLILLLSVIFLIIYSRDVSAGVISGITLAVRSIIPSLFPFLILSDIFIRQFSSGTGVVGRIFSRIFGFPPQAAGAFLCGSFSGFPVGVKCATDLYLGGNINKSELERLICIVNNPSPAFVIAAVGTMRGSTRDGVILYISVILAAILTGIFFLKRGGGKSDITNQPIKTDFSLVTSIKNAAYTSIGISAYIIFFSGLLGIIKAIFKSPDLTLFFSLFLEIGNAASLLAASGLDRTLSLALTAFALVCSGLSVHMQSKSLLPSEISIKKYILMKLVTGMLSAVIVVLILSTVL